jgi:hypothetical protein
MSGDGWAILVLLGATAVIVGVSLLLNAHRRAEAWRAPRRELERIETERSTTGRES